MLFALIGSYDPTMMRVNFERERQVMENPPEGIEVVARYARVGGRGGLIHIVRAESAEDLAALLLEFVDLVQFEVVPIVELAGAKATELIQEYMVEPLPMHGPF